MYVQGLILFVNIAPALAVKLLWPYFITGQIRYRTRVLSCSALSFVGILVSATSFTLTVWLSG